MGLRSAELALTVLFNVVHYSYANDGLACNMSLLHTCPDGQTCIAGKCGCSKSMVLSGDKCTIPEPLPSESGHTSLAAVVLVLATTLVVAGVVLVVRKYQLVEWARRRLEARRNRDMLYEDVMIGQDDPPLTP